MPSRSRVGGIGTGLWAVVGRGMCPSPSRARVHPEKVGSPIEGVEVAHLGRL